MDGFAFIGAGAQGGMMTTPPLLVSAESRALVLNADVGAGGWIQAELLHFPCPGNSHDSNIVEGCGRDDCEPLIGNSLRHVASFAPGVIGRLHGLPGGVALRLYMRDAKVYSFQFQASGITM